MNIDSMRLLHRIRLYRPLLIICLALFSARVTAMQADTGSVVTPHVRASLVSEQRSIEAGQAFLVALHFDIIDGWHTYWKNPGDSGSSPLNCDTKKAIGSDMAGFLPFMINQALISKYRTAFDRRYTNPTTATST